MTNHGTTEGTNRAARPADRVVEGSSGRTPSSTRRNRNAARRGGATTTRQPGGARAMASARAATTVPVRRRASGSTSKATATKNGRASGTRNAGGQGTRARSTSRTSAAATRKAATRKAATNRRRSVLQPGETPRTRGARTRQRVAEALIELVDDGDPSPTAKAVAERAGVSVRLVFHHFEDMDALYGLAVEVQEQQRWSELREVPANLSFDQRIDRTVQQRAKLFETIGPLRRALVPVLSRDAAIAGIAERQEAQLRTALETTFATELRRVGRGRKDLLDALDAALSWEAWDRLRRGQGLGAAAARRAMGRTAAGLLAR